MKPIPKWEALYSISEQGAVWSLRKSRWLRTYRHEAGYEIVTLCKGNKSNKLRVHRLLALAFLGAKDTDEIDHKDRNPKNNALSNLRICTHKQNAANCKGRNAKSGYRGVYAWIHPKYKKVYWRPMLRVQGKARSFGYFEDALLAAKAYDLAALSVHKEFAVLNFPDNGDLHVQRLQMNMGGGGTPASPTIPNATPPPSANNAASLAVEQATYRQQLRRKSIASTNTQAGGGYVPPAGVGPSTPGGNGPVAPK